MKNFVAVLLSIFAIVSCELENDNSYEEDQKKYIEHLKKLKVREDTLFPNFIQKMNVSDTSKINDTLYVVIHEKGDGVVLDAGDVLSTRYTGYLIHDSLVRDETLALNEKLIFDSNTSEGEKLFTFSLGEQGVIKAWNVALVGIRKGTKLSIYTKSDYGYGSRGAGGMIHSYAPLLFKVEIVK